MLEWKNLRNRDIRFIREGSASVGISTQGLDGFHGDLFGLVFTLNHLGSIESGKVGMFLELNSGFFGKLFFFGRILGVDLRLFK
jgi:hypothetical protein